jgi:hypothetical protein
MTKEIIETIKVVFCPHVITGIKQLAGSYKRAELRHLSLETPREMLLSISKRRREDDIKMDL